MKQRPRIYYSSEQKALMWDGFALISIPKTSSLLQATGTCGMKVSRRSAQR